MSSQAATPSETHLVEVSLLGQSMTLRTDEDPRHIERLASYLRRRLDDAAGGGPVSAPKVALLAAMNVADDYFRALEEMRQLKRDVAERSRELLKQLDQITPS